MNSANKKKTKRKVIVPANGTSIFANGACMPSSPLQLSLEDTISLQLLQSRRISYEPKHIIKTQYSNGFTQKSMNGIESCVYIGNPNQTRHLDISS